MQKVGAKCGNIALNGGSPTVGAGGYRRHGTVCIRRHRRIGGSGVVSGTTVTFRRQHYRERPTARWPEELRQRRHPTAPCLSLTAISSGNVTVSNSQALHVAEVCGNAVTLTATSISGPTRRQRGHAERAERQRLPRHQLQDAELQSASATLCNAGAVTWDHRHHAGLDLTWRGCVAFSNVTSGGNLTLKGTSVTQTSGGADPWRQRAHHRRPGVAEWHRDGGQKRQRVGDVSLPEPAH